MRTGPAHGGRPGAREAGFEHGKGRSDGKPPEIRQEGKQTGSSDGKQPEIRQVSDEDMLLLLVQSILPEWNIASVKLTNKENVGLRQDSRKSIFDIACTTSSGTLLNIEMQYRAQEDFNNRMLFYSSFPIHNSVAPGSSDTSTYDPDPLCMIGITNFILRRIKNNNDLINCYRIRNIKDSDIEFTDVISFVTVDHLRHSVGKVVQIV